MGMSGDTALVMAKNYVKKTLQGQGALKGQDGFSPIIEENADNTDKVYKLDITTADSTFTTPNLRGKDGESSGGGEANVIESISVNGTPISVDENKNVDITVPSIDGLAKTEDIPTKVSELTNDSGYLTEHQDISGKVDKVEGKSLISDTEIARLASVDNYDDTDIKAEIAKKADTTSIPRKVSELTNDSNYQTAEQVNSTVTTEIAKVVADAPEDLNTLKEMSDWIAGHEDDASAMNSAISDNKTAITALQKGKADKSEIPTTLPADGGNADTVNNHTVETNVPTDAVFTDTVYDDTEIKYGEIAGGKNLFNGNFIEEVLEAGINYTDVKLIKEQNSVKDIKGITFAVFGAYLKKGTYTFSYTNDAYFSLNRVAIAGTDCVLAIESIRKSYTWTQNTDGWTYFGIEGDDSETGVTDTPFSITPDIQIEEGTQATAYEPYISSVKMLADEVSAQNKSLSDLENAINGLNDDNYWEQGTWNILGQKVDEPTIIRMKEKLILPIDYSVSLVNSNYVYEVDYYENGAYKNDTDWISGSIVIPNGQEFVLLIRKVDNSSLVPTERNAISVLPKNIGTINDKLKNDLAPKKIELQNVDERVTIQDNGSFIINGFAFVNLLVTFNETLPQWSNFVRLPRPKGGNVSVHCENSVKLTIYSQDNLPGDCGTYENVASGTEIRLLVNYEVA